MKHAEASGHRIDRFVVRTGVTLIAAFCFTFGALPGWADALTAQAQPPQAVTASWDILDGVATIGLNSSTLGSLGFRVTDLTPSVSGHALHPLTVVPRGAPSFALDGRIDLRAIVAWDGFRGFEGTSMHTRGGFRLIGPAGTFDLSSLEMRPGAKGGELDLFDAAGMAVLIATEGQWELDAPTGRLRYLNADLRILPDLARLLGDDRYTGVTVGTLDLDATLAAGTLPPVPALPVGVTAPPPCGDWSGTVDVSLTNMSDIGQAGISTVNGRSVVVVLPSANLKNVGTANVPWFSKFTNIGVPPWNDQHPFLVWQMTRSTGSFFEPLGRGDLKHAFLTINSGCDAGACTNSHILGLGCSDVYGIGTNDDTDSLAPRGEVTASTGIWAHCGGIPSHFDTNGDCSQDFFGGGESSFTHGLKAAETDLQVAGATYYVEAFYIIRNDANIFNSMGYRQVAPATASTWTFPTVGAYTQGPPINAWVNPTTPGANADNRTLDTGEGRVQLAVKVTDVVGSPGRKRFAYALQNHDFDRRIKSFKIPFDLAGASITNIVYADGDGFAANDWTATTNATGITWTAPSATTPPAEVDFASLVAFRFDIDRNPVPVQATFGVFEAGPTSTLTLQSLAPAGPDAPTPGLFFTVAPCRLVDTRGTNGPALVPGVERTFNTSGICDIPGIAKALAINVTAIDAAAPGHVVVYSGAFPNTSTINYTVGANRANNAVIGLAADGSFQVMAFQATGTLQLTVDVSGYFQ